MSRRISIIDLASGPAHQYSAPSNSILLSSSPNTLHVNPRPLPPTPPRGVKRPRSEEHPYGYVLPPDFEDDQIESIDLTEPEQISPLAKTLAKQREDAIKAQQPKDDTSDSLLGAYKCPVCMDTPENATSTACGHLFCHNCIIECLNRADEQRLDSTKQVRGTCPVCRKALTRNDAAGPRRSLIPLKLKLMTRKRSLLPPAEA
ncbi:uncharacterized protein N7483_010399 [Penicillium malachiteum]|uniref:uncharacterized protein n=1 Tax=Penicillium malachiteum TaxID=1324776 RepID=UPI0025465D14|nr:uncharacterized protein N7483_010399 [Penicillium malachiteum]KAJ5713218.1 hypothetical protein N7483_010399 [Penicillium malachiteum]